MNNTVYKEDNPLNGFRIAGKPNAGKSGVRHVGTNINLNKGVTPYILETKKELEKFLEL